FPKPPRILTAPSHITQKPQVVFRATPVHSADVGSVPVAGVVGTVSGLGIKYVRNGGAELGSKGFMPGAYWKISNSIESMPKEVAGDWLLSYPTFTHRYN